MGASTAMPISTYTVRAYAAEADLSESVLSW